MPITQQDIDALNEALACGEKSVTINGKVIIYRSIDEIIRARNEMQRVLDAQQPSDTARLRRVMLYHRGRGF